MAAVLLRRSVATVALATFATALVPTAVSLVGPTAAVAATSAPAIDNSKSAPEPNGSLASGGSNITAVFDQEITGTSGKTSGTCKDTSGTNQCSFILYEVNADGSRGVRLPGETTFDTSGTPLDPNDTVVFNPDFSLVTGNSYEAVVQVFGVDSNGKKVASMVTNLDYKVFISTVKPYNLSAPPFANTQNNSAFPLSGYAPSGFTVTATVKNPNGDPTGQTNASGSTLVEPCPSAPLCPWTVTVDISGNEWPSSASNVDWTAEEQDANGTPSTPYSMDASAQTPKATFTIDYSAPDIPSSSSPPTLTQDKSQHTASVNVSAQEADNANNADVNSYLITVTDPSDNKVTQTFPSQGNDLPAHTVDVTTLDDGQLTVLIQAEDTHGNVSDSSCSPFPNQPCSSYSGSGLIKTVGLVPNLGTSTLTSSDGDTTFTDAQQGRAILSPTKVTVGFTQTIKESFDDCCTSSGPVTNHSSMCVATPNGNCLVSAAPTVASDNKSISMKVASKLADGTYAVRVHTYSQSNCPDRTPAGYAANGGNPPSCESYGDLVRIPGTGDPGTAFTFTVDSTSPTVAITKFPNPVTAKNEKSVNIAGTVNKTAEQVQLFISSSGSDNKLFHNTTITTRANTSDPTADWASGPIDISSLPDGQLTIKAVAKNANGTTAHDTVHAKMAAHLSHLTAAVNHSRTVAGKQLKVSGVLSDEHNDPITNAEITVRPRYSAGHFGKAVTVVTDSSTGGYKAKVVAKRNATYVAKYAGAEDHDGVTAATKRVLVHYSVTITSPNFGDHVGSSVTVKGKVGPNHKGAVVTIFRHTSSGNTVIGKATLNKHSRFTAHVVLPPGKDVIFASVKKGAHNLAGKSKRLTLHVS